MSHARFLCAIPRFTHDWIRTSENRFNMTEPLDLLDTCVLVMLLSSSQDDLHRRELNPDLLGENQPS
jgi:hypothetical protein